MNTCDDCGRPNADQVDIHDGAQLCRDCADPYDHQFRTERLRTRLPLAQPDPPTVHRRQP